MKKFLFLAPLLWFTLSAQEVLTEYEIDFDAEEQTFLMNIDEDGITDFVRIKKTYLNIALESQSICFTKGLPNSTYDESELIGTIINKNTRSAKIESIDDKKRKDLVFDLNELNRISIRSMRPYDNSKNKFGEAVYLGKSTFGMHVPNPDSPENKTSEERIE